MFFRKNLVFVFNFDKNHDDWIIKKNPNYDIVLVNVFSENRWKNIAKVYDRYKFKIFWYKTISFIDCDIVISSKKLIEYFEIFNKHKLKFAAPVYKAHDFFSKKKCFLRNVNCLPRKFLTFNKESLSQARQYLLLNESGSGIEWVLPKIFDYKGVSIIDKINVQNSYEDKKQKVVIKDLVAIYNKFDLEHLYNIEFSRIEYEEEKCWCCYVDLSPISNSKFARPSRRSNGCCESDVILSSRMMNSTGENMR